MNVRSVDIKNLNEAVHQIKKIGADQYSIPVMASKSFIRSFVLEGIDNRAANIIKQEMLSLGADAAVSKEVGNFKLGKSNVLIMATPKQYILLLKKLALQPFGLKEWGIKIKKALLSFNKNKFVINCGKRKLVLENSPLIMGILNVTPDSFSDGGRFQDIESAVNHAEEMIAAGADIIDIGGESTKPGSRPVNTFDEISRVIPVIKKLAKRIKIPISIDTSKPEVAKAAIHAGAVIINDITGLQNAKMAEIAALTETPVIIMHMQGTPLTMQKAPAYKDIICDISDFFSKQVEFAVNKGIKQEQIILDPGIGFGKTIEHNLEILRRLKEFKILGMPILVGLSRKTFIGEIIRDNCPKNRIEGSLAGGIWAILNGADILRVHDVKETAKALKMIKYIRG